MKSDTTVLVIDDSPEALEMLNMALSEAGMTVLLALSAQQAYSIIKTIVPDIFVVDAKMPDIDGFNCCETLREQYPLTPILFMTGLTDNESLAKAFQKGANDYLIKPIKPQELITRIHFHQQKAFDIASLQNALDDADHAMLCVDSEAQLQWSTPKITPILDKLFDNTECPFPDFYQWIQLTDQDLTFPIEHQGSLGVLYHQKVLPSGFHIIKYQERQKDITQQMLQETFAMTARESDVLQLLIQGLSNKAIAKAMGISPSTIKKHLEQIYKKLNVDNRAHATAKVMQSAALFN